VDVKFPNDQAAGVDECTESSSDTSSMLMRGDKVMQRSKARAQTRTTSSNCDGSNSGCGCDPGYCWMFGDPHFFTFDGGKVVQNSPPMNLWLVHSSTVQIQGISAAYGRLQGVAVGGNWMKGHKLLLSKKGVTFDDQPILSKTGDNHIVSGVVELYRPAQMSLNETEIKELDGEDHWWEKHRKYWRKFARGGAFYHFKLPLNVEIWVSGASDRLQAMIRMPSQPNQGGYCGNFNGDSKDDWVAGTDTKWLGMAQAAGTMLDPIKESEDLFKQAGISESSSMLQSVTHSQAECSEELMKEAEEACSHIPEKMLHDSCVQDICLTKDVDMANSAMAMEIMHVAVAKGSVELQGPGRCLDQAGAKYSTIKATGISDKGECSKLLHEVSHKVALVNKGIRGAQFKEKGDEESSCQLLLETGADFKIEELPGLWEGQKTDTGFGIVSSSDNVEGWNCWKLV